MPGLPRGSLDKKIRIERPVAAGGIDGAGSGEWVKVGEAWASVQDVLPSRGEQAANGFTSGTRPARVRMDYREDVTGDMRFVLGSRIMQITAGPAEIGRRDGLEFMVVEYSPAGSTA